LTLKDAAKMHHATKSNVTQFLIQARSAAERRLFEARSLSSKFSHRPENGDLFIKESCNKNIFKITIDIHYF
jgi:hypothetical protein